MDTREIMRTDRLRREAREAAELTEMIERYYPTTIATDHKPHAMMIRADAKAAGVVTAHTTRHTAPWATMRDRVVGIAPGTENENDGTCTVLVRNMNDPSVHEVRTVNSFRKGREYKPRNTVTEAPEPTEAQRVLPSQADILGDYS